MTDPIQIVVTDGIASTIVTKLQGISNASVDADTATAALSSQMKQFGGMTGAVTLSAQQLEAALTSGGVGARNLAAAMSALEESATAAAGNIRGYTAAQIEAFQVAQDGFPLLDALNASFVQSGLSARDSAQAFIEQATAAEQAAAALAGYTVAQINMFRAQQEGINFQTTLNESFGITVAAGDAVAKSARDSAAAMSELMTAVEALSAAETEAVTLTRGLTEAQIAQFQAVQNGINFMNDLNASLGINATATKSAADSAAVFVETMDAEIAAAAEAAGANDALAGSMGKNAAATGKANGVWAGLIGTLAAFFAIKEVVSAIDDYTRLQNALTLAGLSGQKLEDEFAQITDIAEANGASVTALASIYQKLAIVQGNTGVSGDKLTTVTQEIAESFRIQGINAQQAYNTMRDLGDIADLTTVKWANFYRLQQADPALVKAAAAGLGISLQQLDQQVQAKTLTTQKFFDGLLKGADAMATLAAATHLTITGALTDLNTAFVKLVDGANQGTGVLFLIAEGIQALAENLPLVTTLVLLFGAAWLLFKTYALAEYFVTQMIPAILAFTAAMIPMVAEVVITAAPFLLWAAGIAAVTYAILVMLGQTDNAANFFKTLASGAVSALGIDKIPEAIKSLTGQLNDGASAMLGFSKGSDSAGSSTDATTKKVKEQETSLQKLYDQVVKMNQSVTTTQLGQDGLNSSVTKTTQAFLGQDNTINKFVTTTDKASNGILNTSRSTQNLTTALSGLGAAMPTVNTGIQQVSQSMTDAYNAANQNSIAAADLGGALTTVITTADGTTASLAKFTDQQIAAAAAMNASSSAAQTLADRLSVLAQRQAASPSLFNDPSNDNGNFTTIGNQTSFPDVTQQPAFASGGSFIVGGKPGVDTNQVRFKATAGEKVTITTAEQQKRQQSGGGNVAHVTMNVYTTDANSFRQSRAQIARDTGSAIQAGMNNG